VTVRIHGDGGLTARGVDTSAIDGALIERARHGDHEAYTALVRNHQDLVFRTAYVMTRSAADSEDVTRDAFVRAYRALGSFREGAPFRPWILRIAVNEARTHRRAVGRRAEASWDAPVDLDGGLAASRQPVDTDATPGERAVALERREILLTALGGLDDEDRLVVAYRFLFDLSDAEVSQALDVPLGTIDSRVARAMKRLRARFPAAD
jgi:RNA polymerase sigma factor (sigma-70 family)